MFARPDDKKQNCTSRESWSIKGVGYCMVEVEKSQTLVSVKWDSIPGMDKLWKYSQIQTHLESWIWNLEVGKATKH